MKLSNLIIICLIVKCGNVSAQLIDDSIAKRCHVKTVIRGEFQDTSNYSRSYIEYYDTNGKKTQGVQFYNNISSWESRELCYYNQNGQLITTTWNYSQLNRGPDTINWVYYSNGNLKNRSGESIRKYKYDDKGRIIEEHKSSFKDKFIYDTEGRVSRKTVYSHHFLYYIELMNYNQYGQLIKYTITYFKSLKVPEHKFATTYFYDNKGLITKEIVTAVSVVPDNKPEYDVDTFTYTFY